MSEESFGKDVKQKFKLQVARLLLDFSKVPTNVVKTLAEHTGADFGGLQYCKGRGKDELKL